MSKRIKAAVIGGSGYVGLELIKLIVQHPHFELLAVTSRENNGKEISELHPSLMRLTDVKFSSIEQLPEEIEIAFISVPHTQAIPIVKNLTERASYKKGTLKVIDLGGDFRLNATDFEHYYKMVHVAPELLSQAVYGNTELNRQEIAGASLVANPGCFAICVTLGLTPVISGLAKISGSSLPITVFSSAVTGSTGSGITPTIKTHHPERNNSMSAYEVLTHRHIPEIENALSLTLQPRTLKPATVHLVPQSGPFSRGIFATSFISLPQKNLPITQWYQDFSEMNRFVRIRTSSPRVLDVHGTNFCDIQVIQKENQLVVISTVDNLVKGAAGTALQNANLMFGYSEALGIVPI